MLGITAEWATAAHDLDKSGDPVALILARFALYWAYWAQQLTDLDAEDDNRSAVAVDDDEALETEADPLVVASEEVVAKPRHFSTSDEVGEPGKLPKSPSRRKISLAADPVALGNVVSDVSHTTKPEKHVHFNETITVARIISTIEGADCVASEVDAVLNDDSPLSLETKIRRKLTGEKRANLETPFPNVSRFTKETHPRMMQLLDEICKRANAIVNELSPHASASKKQDAIAKRDAIIQACNVFCNTIENSRNIPGDNTLLVNSRYILKAYENDYPIGRGTSDQEAFLEICEALGSHRKQGWFSGAANLWGACNTKSITLICTAARRIQKQSKAAGVLPGNPVASLPPAGELLRDFSRSPA